MSPKFVDVEDQYKRNKNLRKEDVQSLLNWAHKESHLPKINELQALIFLQSCDCSNELAKITIDNFFTGRTLMSDVFTNRDPLSHQLRPVIDQTLITTLPKKTPEGYTIFFFKFMNSRPEDYHFPSQLKFFDMVCMRHLYQEGISKGHVVVADARGMSLGHVTKMSPLLMKKFMGYVQEALPVSLKQIHFYNTTPVMGKLLGLMKPFMKPGLVDILYLHENLNSLTKFVPLECLPEELGGKVDSMSVLHKDIIEKLEKSTDLFQWEETFEVDESKRIGKFKNGNVYGVDGTFKKLEID